MKLHRMENGDFLVKITGIDGHIITSSWVEAMKIAWAVGGVKNA